tara:strand:- start:284 stop:637 length:354 start_codon:yes stop_codon:yes gene_type:complete
MTVRMKKEVLVNKLKENREKHEKDYAEAKIGFRKEVEEILLNRLEEIRAGRNIKMFIDIPIPTNHLKDYDRTLKMLEMDIRLEIELPEDKFAKYVLDDWEWKHEFDNTVSNYTRALR